VCKTRNVAQEKNILGKYALIMSRFKHLERVFAHKATVTESRDIQYTFFRAVRIDYSFPLTRICDIE